MAFKPAPTTINIPEIEDGVIAYWKQNRVFEKSIEQRPVDKQWNFLDGPPFITGLPHYGTLLSSIPKDVFPRFWTMKGYRVRRVWGWDCHGLPAENKVEKKLGLKRKRDIEEKIGVKKFIEECKLYVNEVSGEWEWYVDHIARWVDLKNAYKTMDLSYMETVMWVFKQMYDKGHVYKGARVSLYCPHCSTPISNFEVAMDPDNYKDVTEASNTYKYKLVGENVYLLAWSTTPWNKIATPALAVNPDMDYVQVEQGSEHYILAKNTLKMLKDEKYTLEKTFKGKDLVGRKFEPHYDFYKIDEGKRAFEIIAGDFVTEEEGTGVVTIAAYGEEDMVAMQKNNIQIVMHVDDEGKMKADVPNWAGMYYLDVNPLVNEDLAARGLMYREDQHTHSVAHCWRCGTRLIFAPQDAWYVNVQKLKEQMEQTNESVNWFPEHFKHGRFLNSMKSAPDWCISRSRYWGSPVPVWECECGERYVPGSIAELEQMSGQKVVELHKPDIDEVLVKCTKCGKDAHRVPEVLDSWTEAGSASFAERHYPFDKSVKKEDFFPPDFIVEYTGQIRAWFYVLHVISNALLGQASFKNVLVTGVILGTDGRKMSKNFGNYPDPKEMLKKYGGDALRLYLLGTPVMRGEDIIISEVEYSNQVRTFLLILWNVYNYFASYANIDGWTPSRTATVSDNILDKWILSLLNQTGYEVTKALEGYDSIQAVVAVRKFVDELSSWYVRRSRDRSDKTNFYSTTYQVLTTFTKMLAPLAPFISDEIYKNLTDEISVHLTDWPVFTEARPNETQLLEDMRQVRKIVELGLGQRKELAIKVRQPLRSANVSGKSLDDQLVQLIKDELNVKEVVFVEGEEMKVVLDTKLDDELIEEGKVRDQIRAIQELRKQQAAKLSQHINVTLTEMPKNPDLLAELVRKTLAKEVKLGSELAIELL